MGVALVLSPTEAGGCSGEVSGTLTFFDAPPGAGLKGTLAPGPGGCELAGPVSWSALPAEAFAKARGDALDVRFRGERTEAGRRRPVDWRAAVPRAAVGLTESMKVTLRRFVKATEIHLGGLGVKTTTVNAQVGVLSPLRFDLRVLEARYEVEANGRTVASGVKEKFIVHGGRSREG